ncbi:hypothetical protein WA158_005196 [Blastocystis sp. Blastoise]
MFRQSSFIVIFIICVLIHSCEAETKDKRLATIINNNFYLYLSDRNYTDYLESSSRPYDSLVFFSVTDPRYQCRACSEVDSVPQEMARSYKSYYTPDKPVVFVKLYFEESKEVYRNYNFDTVPVIAYIPKSAKLTSKSHWKIEKKNIYEKQDFSVSALFSFFNTKTGLNVKPAISESNIYISLLIVIVITVVICYMMPFGDNLWNAAQNRYNWFILVMIVLFVCIAGLPYDIIHKTSLYQQNPYSPSSYIYVVRDIPSYIYVLEGFSISFWVITAGISAILMIQSPVLFKNSFQAQFMFCLCLSIFIAGIWEYWKDYVYKNKWIENGVMQHFYTIIDSFSKWTNPRYRQKIQKKIYKYFNKIQKELSSL